jgi:large subunit ribosomal protein L5
MAETKTTKTAATKPAAVKPAAAKAPAAKPAEVKAKASPAKPTPAKVEKPAAAVKAAPAKAAAPAAKTEVKAPAKAPVAKAAPAPVKAADKPAAKPAATPAKAAAPAAPKAAPKTVKKSRLHDFYIKTVVPAAKKELGYKNVNQVPKINKIVINSGLGKEKDNSKSFNLALEELGLITGQKPIATVAKKSVSNFKVREGLKIGAKVTLRGERMYEFLDRLIAIVLPRVRDFKGISPKAFDGRGNYALGIKEQSIFPEISYEKVDKVRGYDIIIVTTARTDKEALTLLTLMGLPFRDR